MHPKRVKTNRLLLAGAALVLIACVGTALFFGETSPVVASGNIVLPDSMAAQARDMRKLYVIVRDADSPMPMPWGAIVTTLDKDPQGEVYSFKLTKDNLRVMNTEAPPPKNITVKARLDLDGLGGADMPGDIVGTIKSIPFGSQGLKIELSELVAETTQITGP